MSEITPKKPWPRDAIMLVCASPAEAKTDVMESVHPGNCRACGAAIVWGGRSMNVALAHPFRRDRPVSFFCVECAVQHDMQSIQHLEDLRGGRREVLRAYMP